MLRLYQGNGFIRFATIKYKDRVVQTTLFLLKDKKDLNI